MFFQFIPCFLDAFVISCVLPAPLFSECISSCFSDCSCVFAMRLCLHPFSNYLHVSVDALVSLCVLLLPRFVLTL